MIRNLLRQPIFVCLQELFDLAHSQFFIVKLTFQIISSRKFIVDIVLHAYYFVLGLLHLLRNPRFQIFHFF